MGQSLAMAFRNDRDALEAKVRALESQNEALQSENEALHERLEAALGEVSRGEHAEARVRADEGQTRRALREAAERRERGEALESDLSRARKQDEKRDLRGATIVLTFTGGIGLGAFENGTLSELLIMTASGLLIGMTIWAIIVHRTVTDDGPPHRSRLAAPILGAQSVVMASLCYGLTRQGPRATITAGAMVLVYIALVTWLLVRTRRPQT